MLTHTFTEYGQPRITIHEISNNLDLDAPLKLHSYHLIMVEAGHMTVDLNFNIYEMTGNSTLHISAGDTIRNIVLLKTSRVIT